MKLISIDLDEITILFVGLKLSGHVSWSWGIVLVPSLVGIAFKLFMAWRNRKS